jgi:hypothetical protein
MGERQAGAGNVGPDHPGAVGLLRLDQTTSPGPRPARRYLDGSRNPRLRHREGPPSALLSGPTGTAMSRAWRETVPEGCTPPNSAKTVLTRSTGLRRGQLRLASRRGADGGRYTEPELTRPPDQASPSGAATATGSLWVAALRGERLWQIPLRRTGAVSVPVAHFTGDYGRLRAVVRAPDGSLWCTTSNRDGRRNPRPGDDKILVIPVRLG